MKKYILTDEKISLYGRTLYRIQRISDGLLGGFVESESNLSHASSCFIYDEAHVFGKARVYGKAWVFGEAHVCDKAHVYGNARVSGEAYVCGKAHVYGNARVYGNAQVFGEAHVYGKAHVYGTARVSGEAQVHGNARVSGEAHVYGKAQVSGKYDLPNIHFKHQITITDEHIIIGCEFHTIAHWSKNITKIGRKHVYTSDEIKATILIIRSVLNKRKVG